MKKIALLGALIAVALVVGCEDPKLATCQEENAALQGQISQLKADLDEVNGQIQRKDTEIEKLRTENTDVQKQALDSIFTMMQKQNTANIEKDKKIKAAQDKIKQLETQAEELEAKIAELTAE